MVDSSPDLLKFSFFSELSFRMLARHIYRAPRVVEAPERKECTHISTVEQVSAEYIYIHLGEPESALIHIMPVDTRARGSRSETPKKESHTYIYMPCNRGYAREWGRSETLERRGPNESRPMGGRVRVALLGANAFFFLTARSDRL